MRIYRCVPDIIVFLDVTCTPRHYVEQITILQSEAICMQAIVCQALVSEASVKVRAQQHGETLCTHRQSEIDLVKGHINVWHVHQSYNLYIEETGTSSKVLHVA